MECSLIGKMFMEDLDVYVDAYRVDCVIKKEDGTLCSNIVII